jgi:hypothetical protein
MNDVQSLSHSKWKCKYHVTWIPKLGKTAFVINDTSVNGAVGNGRYYPVKRHRDAANDGESLCPPPED